MQSRYAPGRFFAAFSVTGTRLFWLSVHRLPVSCSLYKPPETFLYQRREASSCPMQQWICPIRIFGLFSVLSSSTTPTNSPGWKWQSSSGCGWTGSMSISSSHLSSAYSLARLTASCFLSLAVRRSYVRCACSLECLRAVAKDSFRASVQSL